MAATRLLYGSQLITKDVLSVRPVQRTKESVNFLLDGSLHIQTIGEPMKGFEVAFLCDSDKQVDLDDYASQKTVLKFERRGVRYDVMIIGDPEWSDFADLDYHGRVFLATLAEEAM